MRSLPCAPISTTSSPSCTSSVDDAGELIHRDRRRDGAPQAAHEHVGAPAREARIAVGVAHRHVGDAQGSRRDQAPAVAGRLPGSQVAQPGHAARPAQSGPQPVLGGIAVERRHAVERDAAAHRVEVRVRAASARPRSWRGGAGRAGTRAPAPRRRRSARPAKAGSSSAVARCDITPGQPQRAVSRRQLAAHGERIGGRHAPAAHAGVGLDVHGARHAGGAQPGVVLERRHARSRSPRPRPPHRARVARARRSARASPSASRSSRASSSVAQQMRSAPAASAVPAHRRRRGRSRRP